MNKTRLIGIILLLLAGLIFLLPGEYSSAAQDDPDLVYISGIVQDEQFQPVKSAQVDLVEETSSSEYLILSSSATQPDGSYIVSLPPSVPRNIILHFSRPHFEDISENLTLPDLTEVKDGHSISHPTVIMVRQISPAFWLAAVVFIIVLILIALGFLHNTLAAFSGASFLLAISYLFRTNLYIFNFSQAFSYIDWNVIFLIMGMMMVIAVVENTGIFHWLAYFAYRISKGKLWILLIVLMLITGVPQLFWIMSRPCY